MVHAEQAWSHVVTQTGEPKEYDVDHLDRLINENEAANFLGYSVRALQNWRVRGGGPRFVKVSSRSVRYRRRELLEWTECLLRSNSSQSDTR